MADIQDFHLTSFRIEQDDKKFSKISSIEISAERLKIG